MPGELGCWYVPLRVILAFTQPAGNLFRSLMVVDFGDDERALLGKKLLSSAQDFILTALHVDFHQLRRGYTRANKVVAADYRYVYYFTAPQYGAVSVSLHPALRPRGCATTKANSIDRGTRPYRGVNHSRAILQPIPRTVFLQPRDVLGVTIESYNQAQVAHKHSCPASHRPHMSPDVIDNRTRPNLCQNRILHLGFVLSAPKERFSRKAEVHPHSLG